MSVAEELFDMKTKDLLMELLQRPPVLFNPHRIVIMVELYCAGAVDFAQLKYDFGLTDGALATHLKALAKEGLIESRREPMGSRVRTGYVITKKGISAVERMFEILCEVRRGFRR